jgi:hypothetical protein
MEDIPTKISSEHKCHCCIGEENIELCELEKCNYPLCATCKQKILDFDNKCPCCRREISISIDEKRLDSEDESENIGKCTVKILCIQKFTFKLISISILMSILLCLGRLFMIITNFGLSKNFWFTGFEKPVYLFFIHAISGSFCIIIIFLFFFCVIGAISNF